MTRPKPKMTERQRVEAWRQREGQKERGRRLRGAHPRYLGTNSAGAYRNAATSLGLVPADLAFFTENIRRLNDELGIARASSWPRKVLRIFRAQLGEIARGERKELPPGMVLEMKAMLTGKMVDPSGRDVVVDTRTAAKVAELFARISNPGVLSDKTIDDHHAWDDAARERDRMEGPTKDLIS